MNVQHVSKLIHHRLILKDIDFTIESGSIIGIVGRNGAGKTTLLRTMAGILNPTSGDVLVKNKSIFQHPQLKEQIIFVPDSTEAMKNYSTKEMIFLYKTIYPGFDEAYMRELMERFQLEQINKIGNYSKGMKALFQLIAAFATGASYILLDEPTDGLDVIVKRQVLQLLVEEVAEKDLSVLISSHRLDELEFMADEIIMIRDGEVDSHYKLGDLSSRYRKAQLVPSSPLPDHILSSLYVLDKTGRVMTILFEADSSIEKELEQSNPVLFETLPLSLEDYFVAKLGGDRLAE
ncbi:ABC transporter ATP-binding protein [Alkalicoccus luteus]|uniref:ABC transporter ATP-binding protein n=1 Tax=Alkalicoccus luteus TaxID=1237094 RepID=A0A969PPK8_9BACI|nr:ABC transporter ATP-binding protein [Alkalicoccus luteus]NJP36629.1 ABC transporter ATP-binding protein [Alkalicoccus luteus]